VEAANGAVPNTYALFPGKMEATTVVAGGSGMIVDVQNDHRCRRGDRDGLSASPSSVSSKFLPVCWVGILDIA
jgi:hypothetical protein